VKLGKQKAEMENGTDRRSGVAVIIVLGMLALLMTMAVAFSISMRIERRSAGNYASSVAGKQLVWGGLSRAISDIEDSMANGGAVYPPWDVLLSANGSTAATLTQGEAFDYIPGCLQSAITNTATWEPFSSGGDGYYAYLVLNCSDLLDVNFVGGEDVRGGGTNINEIQISDFPSIQNWDDFRGDRDADMRYECLPELATLNSGIDPAPEYPDYFETYSRFPYEEDLVSLRGPEAELRTRRSEIESRLASVVSNGDGHFMFDSLIDYIDTNSIPHALDGPYVERVPMINEIWVGRVLARRRGDTCDFNRPPQVKVELVFPFAEPSSDTFALEIALSLEVADATTVYYSETNTVRQNIPSATAVHDTLQVIPSGLSFPLSLSVSNSNPLTVSLAMKCKVLITSDGDQVVDAVPYPESDAGFNFTVDVAPGDGRTDATTPSWECIDPRFNWRVRRFWMLRAAGNSEDSLNDVTGQYFLANPRTGGNDADLGMRVSNRGSFFSVGELGNLLRRNHLQSRFKTIRLYDMGNTSRDRVFENFTVTTNLVGRGLVHVNSVANEILESAFVDVPVGYPEALARVSSGLATAIAQEIYNNGPYTNVGGMCDMDWSLIPGLGVGTYSEQGRESVVAHTCNLLGARQNLFTIIVAASPSAQQMGQYAEDQGIVQTLGEQRAVFQVWRDPVDEDGDGRHECFVRYVKWLQD
jgi:hypothetical protein